MVAASKLSRGHRYMIVNQFQAWALTASPTSRANGASALARAYLTSNLDAKQRTDAIRTLTALLDDPSPLVRRALADAFADTSEAPHHIVLALADDQSSIASIVLGRSPLFSEAELIDCAASADAFAQSAIAARADLTSPVAAALAEIAAPEALIVLARNHVLRLPAFSIRRMVERHGDRPDLREALLKRPDLPPCARVDLVAATANALAHFVVGRNWMSEDRLARVTREAKDRAAIVIADTSHSSAPALVTYLRQAGQLTVGFVFRAILSGKTELFSAALANLSGMPLARVEGLVDHFESTGFAALYRKAALPIDLIAAFRVALRAVREVDWTMAYGVGLSRAVIERVLTGCEAVNNGELDTLIVLLRRFETEAARDEAREASNVAARQPTLALRTSAEPLLLVDIDETETRLLPLPLRSESPTRTADVDTQVECTPRQLEPEMQATDNADTHVGDLPLHVEPEMETTDDDDTNVDDPPLHVEPELRATTDAVIHVDVPPLQLEPELRATTDAVIHVDEPPLHVGPQMHTTDDVDTYDDLLSLRLEPELYITEAVDAGGIHPPLRFELVTTTKDDTNIRDSFVRPHFQRVASVTSLKAIEAKLWAA